MSLVFLRASLAVWRRRLAYRHARHLYYHRRSRRPQPERRRLAVKWHRLESEAAAMVQRRVAQLAQARTPSPRARAVAYARSFAGRLREAPPGSNRSPILDGWVREVGSYLGAPWCGIACGVWLRHAGVQGITNRIAAVAYIEDDARARRAPFRAWTTDPRAVLRGDLVVLFGRGVHVELVERVDRARGVVYTTGGNTSPGVTGSQSNGGGCYRRVRPLALAYGFALVNYPG